MTNLKSAKPLFLKRKLNLIKLAKYTMSKRCFLNNRMLISPKIFL